LNQPLARSILIVEDCMPDLMLAVARLSFDGYELLLAERGDWAVQVALENRASLALIVMDLMLPGKTGIQAIREIREFLPAVPIMVLTAYPEMTRGPAMEAGATAFMDKADIAGAMRKACELLGG